jgi:hypothetical protein
MMKKILIIIASFVLLSSVCLGANQQAASTEITGFDKKPITDELVKTMMDEGYNIKTTNDYQMVFCKDLTDFKSMFFLGSKFNGTPEMRITFNIVQLDKIVKITADAKAVTNPNSGFERYTQVNPQNIQPLLDNIKFKFNGAMMYGLKVDQEKVDNCFEITYIYKNSNCEKAGIQVGDLIVAINDVKTSKIKYKQAMDCLRFEPVKLLIRDSAGDEREITLRKGFVPGDYQTPEKPKE